jgi:AcrR family transcriptional regulator
VRTPRHCRKRRRMILLTRVKYILTKALLSAQYLTMVKSDPATDNGEQTRRQIAKSDLRLFRERGFDSTTTQVKATHDSTRRDHNH